MAVASSFLKKWDFEILVSKKFQILGLTGPVVSGGGLLIEIPGHKLLIIGHTLQILVHKLERTPPTLGNGMQPVEE